VADLCGRTSWLSARDELDEPCGDRSEDGNGRDRGVDSSSQALDVAAQIVQFCVEPVDDRFVIPTLMLDLLQPLLKLTDLALGYSHEANSRFDLRNSTPKISCVAMPCSTVMPSFAMSAT